MLRGNPSSQPIATKLSIKTPIRIDPTVTEISTGHTICAMERFNMDELVPSKITGIAVRIMNAHQNIANAADLNSIKSPFEVNLNRKLK